MNFEKYFIVRKLDDSDSARVNEIIARITNIANAVKWEQVAQVEDSGLIIAIGGDGTMLHAMRLSKEVATPVLGFNIGKLGFLSEFQPEQIEEAIIALANNKWKIEERSVLCESTFSVNAINEFVIAPAQSKNTLKYEFFINGVSSGTHHANSLIISTPTGSTAYSLSVGGAILQPNAPVFQIVPVAPMSLNSRSVIVSDQSSICVRIKLLRNVDYHLVADGQVVGEFNGFADGKNEECHMLKFNRTYKDALLIHGESWNFFDVLQEKLRWNTVI